MVESGMFNICRKINEILEIAKRLDKRTDEMTATIAQLDAALAAEATQENTLAAAITKLAADYSALVAQASNGVDVTTELNDVNANAAQLATIITAVQTADPATVPVTPTSSS